MLEKPAIQDEQIIRRLQTVYGLHALDLTFLPLGADVNTAVYRVVSREGRGYFLKLRKGSFHQITVTLPAWLNAAGITSVIAPLETLSRQFWAPMGRYKLILYPFVEGKNGYESDLSAQHWLDFGAALHALHTVDLPPRLSRLIPRERYSPLWRDLVTSLQAQVRQAVFADPAAAGLAAVMRENEETISRLVARAHDLTRELQAHPRKFTLCHSDIHAGNLHAGSDGKLYIVDWDNPTLAPKEHDLTLIGGCDLWNAAEQKALFYQGYGPAEIDRTALAYYRSERVIQDIAEFGKQLLLSDEGGPDREQALIYFSSNFLPGHEIDLANQTG